MTHFVLKTASISLVTVVFAPLFIGAFALAAEPPVKTEPPVKDVSTQAVAPVLSTAASAYKPKDEEPRPYDKTRDARADVDAALFAAKSAGKNAIIVMGANWCHDSRDLVAHFMTPRFQTLLAQNFEYVYVDVGVRDRNLDIAADFGIDKVEGTPTIVIVSPGGEVLNLETAKTWRNAASRSDDDIYNAFASFAVNPAE